MKTRSDYTFKYNKNLGRHGWLRLTPAYSVKLVEEILCSNSLFQKRNITGGRILDPFCGTATTGIVAAEHGLHCSLYEINPFLCWFGSIKSANYDSTEIENLYRDIAEKLTDDSYASYYKMWIPPMKNINRWWDDITLASLGKLHEFLIDNYGGPTICHNNHNLLWVGFSRLVIETSAADYGHVSVSFKDSCSAFGEAEIIALYLSILQSICSTASNHIAGSIQIKHGDSRNICLDDKVNYVITSPPYPNRISYIRELRPYMYWLGFLSSGEEAGEMDWKAIGGTWGSATSKLNTWKCGNDWDIPQCLQKSIDKISATDSKNGKTLSQYVLKFFYDMHLHLKNLKKNLAEGCELYYVLGNSSFYGNMVHTDLIMCELMQRLGYENPKAKIIRKRNCKKELFEFLITARWCG